MMDSMAEFGTDAFTWNRIYDAVTVSSDKILINDEWINIKVPIELRVEVNEIIKSVFNAEFNQTKLTVYTKSLFISRLRETIFKRLGARRRSPRPGEIATPIEWASIFPPIPSEETYVTDNRPSRFSRIAEEMTTEIELKTGAESSNSYELRVRDGKPECPRCGCRAFEPSRRDGAYVVACLGCPLPAPVFDVPEGVAFKTSPYRCGSCGKQVAVTMSLSELNLHCGSCGRLTLHARRDPLPPLYMLTPGRSNTFGYAEYTATTQRGHLDERRRTTRTDPRRHARARPTTGGLAAGPGKGRDGRPPKRRDPEIRPCLGNQRPPKPPVAGSPRPSAARARWSAGCATRGPTLPGAWTRSRSSSPHSSRSIRDNSRTISVRCSTSSRKLRQPGSYSPKTTPT